jgi:hypothetical protein
MMKLTTNINALGWRLFLTSAAIAIVPALAGCQNRPAPESELTYGDKFPGPDEPRHVNRVQEAQAAAGARSDATLRLCHFDTGGGNPGALNSLGEEKLDLMLVADAGMPLVLNLDVPQDDAYNAREQAIRIFLKDRGLTDSQVKVVAGPNVRNSKPTAPLLAAQQAAAAAAPAAGGAPSLSPAPGGMGSK